MNPVLVFLILIISFIMWALCSFVFYPLGLFVYNRAKKIKENMDKDDEKEEDFEEKEEV